LGRVGFGGRVQEPGNQRHADELRQARGLHLGHQVGAVDFSRDIWTSSDCSSCSLASVSGLRSGRGKIHDEGKAKRQAQDRRQNPRPKPPISRTLTILENAATIELSSSRHIVLRNRSRSAG
jgi:hypothetical protein